MANNDGIGGSGLVLTHDREWDYELDRIADAVAEKDAETIGLQFPEGLKRQSTDVVDDIDAYLDRDVSMLVSGKPCYGACDLDMELARRTDLFIHFGHTPMQNSDGMIYVPLFSNVDPLPIVEQALESIPNSTEKVGLTTTAQHLNKIDGIKKFIKNDGYTPLTDDGDERLTREGQVLGCNYTSADLDAEYLLYVGGGKFHPVGLAMEHPEKTVVIADPVNNIVTEAESEQFIKKRYATIHKAMDATTWGVIYCTKIGQGRWETATEIVEDNENAYLITTDEVTPDRLHSFDVDAFVNTGCPRITTDDGPQFPKPLLTPEEYEIATGQKPMDELSFDTFHGTW
ncbi:diphthamide biosynthesis enzyme Dph2 [Salinarchaeum sp. IM2453]|uniref:diphthamide biosynthesis enzyme Dph2 n=1 Tax=Salinarchaeum sp. IM2453 TaxID=2862870 RepID=UPI001C83B230|nr:diphthamide biosynthesis enzyme Dph2 [Salinarchaeum sp. IM2453]QZA88159.1 diphthamide biosynthesis enzyme Dph2 [Salinarchaeum sp. IM2453]